MPTRILLSFSLLVLFVSTGAVLAQNPPRPAEPASPPAAAQTFDLPDVFFGGRNYLGVAVEVVTEENMSQYNLHEPRGVIVTQVLESSPAERAGIKKGDVILRFDGETVTTARKLQRLINEAAPEQTVRLSISRGGNEQELSVKLARREEGARAFIIPELSAEQRRQFEDFARRGGSFNMVLGSQRRIGVTTSELTKQLADYFGVTGGHGLLVTSVTEGGPSARAGIKAGDVITAVDGNAVDDAMDLISQLNRQSSGDVTITIVRERRERTVKVTPEQRRASDLEFHEITPQIGQISIPPMNIQVPRVNFAMPRMNMQMPRIVIPPMPPMHITVPRVLQLPDMEIM